MDWISVKDKMPKLNQRVLVYRIIHMGGYIPGIYMAIYAKPPRYDSDFFIIDDMETNTNNYRPLKEFSHWMPLPEKPI